MKYKDSNEDLPAQLPAVSRKATVITLEILLILALTFVDFGVGKVSKVDVQQTIQIEDIPITHEKIKQEKPPAPKRAEVIEDKSDEAPDTVTLATTDLNVDSFVPTIPEEDEEIYEFFAVDQPAELVTRVAPKYPEMARKAGLEGTVIVQIVVGKDGKVESAKVIKVMKAPKGVFEQAALDAAKQFVFKPAKQRDHFVKVKKQQPFIFKLK